MGAKFSLASLYICSKQKIILLYNLSIFYYYILYQILNACFSTQKIYWVKANEKFYRYSKNFSNNCKKKSNADLGEIYKCRFCKSEHAKVVPRYHVLLNIYFIYLKKQYIHMLCSPLQSKCFCAL